MGMSLEVLKSDLLLSKPSFEQMNVNKISFNQEMEYAIQAFKGNTALLNCDPDTLRNSLVNVSLSGLSLSPVMKLAYLVPRKNKCCLDPSYMGLIKIITDTGSVKSIKAKTVYENEPFDIEQGTNGYVKHSICKNGNRGKRIGAYSFAELNDGSFHVEWMYESELMAVKTRSRTSADGTPWKTDEDEMCRKTVVKRHWKYLPKSERAAMASQAIAFDNDVNGIDFEKEKKEAANNTASDNGFTSHIEMASDEIVAELLTLLDDGNLGESFISKPTLTIKTMKSGIERKFNEQTLEMEKAVEYKKMLEWEIDQAIKTKEAEMEGSAGEEPKGE